MLLTFCIQGRGMVKDFWEEIFGLNVATVRVPAVYKAAKVLEAT